MSAANTGTTDPPQIDPGMDLGKPGPAKTMDTRWTLLQELFSRAVELPASEREAFIVRETADDADLRKELLSMVACDSGQSTGPLTHALGAALDATTRDRRRAMLGKIVGNYKLASVLGHGGTGTVYLGERADRQYSAQVAVKIIDTATVHGDLGMRFRAERQILASLNHPNIARLLDAGETQEGQPYLVMEYVHGEPVDRYCDRAQLDVRARLELFLEICSAVQYAHQNLIVHRDLKPANILVTAEGAPKLLDFGIAKLLDAGDAASMLALTRMNDRLLTPEYASPEQILGRPVTTGSDVYALGVVLYELLTGLRPYVVPASASQLELERSICVTDPLRPSAAIRRAAEAGATEGQSSMLSIAAARGLTAERLQRKMIGDIDAIVMRALRKEPQHRYGSIEQFTADVRRYLTREPVLARQGNWLYYSQRFVRRHAFGVTVTTAFVLFVLAFAIIMSVQRQRIAEERDRATQESERAAKVSKFMVDVFADADPFTNFGEPRTATDLLDGAARRIQGDLNERPEVRVGLLEAMGRAYRRAGQSDRAVTFLEDSVRIREQARMPRDAQTGQVLTDLAIALRSVGRFDESDRRFREAMQLSQTTEGEQTMTQARLLVDLGRLELNRGNLDAAEGYLTRGLTLARKIEGPRTTEVAAILSDMSNVRAWRDDLDGAEQAAVQAVNIYRETANDYHPDRVMADYRLAEVLFLKGRTTDASVLYERALTAQRVLYGNASSQVADTLDSLARVRLIQNDPDDAAKLTREAIEINLNARGPNNYMTGYLQTNLAQILARQGKYAEAEKNLRDALDLYARTLPADHQYVASSEYVLGEVLLATGRLPDAEAMLTASMNRWKRTDASPWRSARSASALGETLYRQGRLPDAEKYLVQSYRELSASTGANHEVLQKARERVARFYTDRGQRHKLDELMLVNDHDVDAAKTGRPN